MSAKTSEQPLSHEHEKQLGYEPIGVDRQAFLERVEALVEIPELTAEQKLEVIGRQVSDYDSLVTSREGTAGPFGLVRGVWDDMAEIAHSPEWESGYFSPAQMAAQKLYCAALFETIVGREKDGLMTDSETGKIYEAYFSSSDLPTDYTGGYASELELYALSRRSETGRRLSDNIMAGLLYSGTFSDIRPALMEAWRVQSSAASRLNYLSALDILAQNALNLAYGDGRMEEYLREALEAIAKSDSSTVLTTKFAEAIRQVTEYNGDNWIYLDELPQEEQARLLERHEQVRAEAAKLQEELHKEFPQFSGDAILRRLAKGACSSVEQGEYGRLVLADGKEANLHRPNEDNSAGLGEEEINLIKAAHHPVIIDTVRLESGVDLADVPLGTQLRFFKFMAEAKPERYQRLCAATLDTSGDNRRVLLDAFLATEFGEDFGDTLLTLTEKLSGEQTEPLLESIQYIREYGTRFAEQFKGFDDNIVDEIKRAIGERVTEVLYVARGLAEADEGSISSRVLGSRITVKSMDEIMDALSLIGQGLERINAAERSGVTAGSYDEQNRSAWHLGTEGDVLLQIKPRGERRGEHVKGFEYSEEAQINYSVDVVTNDGDYVPTHIANYRRRYALSIRLDLEGILRDANGGRAGFDATREQLTAALDMGSLRGVADNPNVRVARVITLGNKLRRRELGMGKSRGYHTNLTPEYGRSARFAALAEFMRAKYRGRVLGRVAVANAPDQSPHPSSASRSGKAAA